jgi:multicomponent Na+:H+ antiporter subunit G
LNANAIIEIIVLGCVLIGTVVTLFSSLGVLRLPDVYTRAHATTKSSTLGILFILLGAFIHFMHTHQMISIRLLLGIVFVFLTAPVAGHMVIRSAHRSGVPLADISVEDVLKEDLEKNRVLRDETSEEKHLVKEMQE